MFPSPLPRSERDSRPTKVNTAAITHAPTKTTRKKKEQQQRRRSSFYCQVDANDLNQQHLIEKKKMRKLEFFRPINPDDDDDEGCRGAARLFGRINQVEPKWKRPKRKKEKRVACQALVPPSMTYRLWGRPSFFLSFETWKSCCHRRRARLSSTLLLERTGKHVRKSP